MYYRSEFDELFTHLCWKYGLDCYETDIDELERYCTEDEARQLAATWNPELDG